MKKVLLTILACAAVFTACKEEVVMVKSINLSETTKSIVEGETYQLKATVLPDNASDKTITWASDNSGVVTVDASGMLTAVKVGEANVKVSAQDGSGVTATCKVTVEAKAIPVTKIYLFYSYHKLNVGESVTNDATVEPENATNKTVIYSSSVPEVASVDDKGLIIAKKAGKTIIVATATDGSGVKSQDCEIEVVEPKPICLDIPYAVMKVSPKCKTITLKGYYGESIENVVKNWAAREEVEGGTWSTSSEGIVTVDGGKLTAVAQGKATVTLTDKTGTTATCEVEVLPDTTTPSDFYPGIVVADCSLTVQADPAVQLSEGPWSAKKSTLTNAEGYIPGSVCIENKNVVNYRLFNYYNSSKSVDVSSVENPALYIRLWVEDYTKVNWGVDGEIEISSNGSDSYNGSEEINWQLKDVFANATNPTGKGKQSIHNGWNIIVLPFDSCSGKIGELRKNHINFFRIYQSTGSLIQGGNLKLDQVRVINWKEFDTCEEYDKWYDGNGVPQRQWKYYTDDKKQGNMSMGFENYLWSGADSFRLKFWNKSGKGYEYSVPFDMDENNTVLKLWVYIDKPEFLNKQQVEFEFSSELNVTDVYHWIDAAGSSTFKAGWNELTLPCKKDCKSGNGDLHKINWFRMVFQFNNGVAPEIINLKVDDIRIEKKAE